MKKLIMAVALSACFAPHVAMAANPGERCGNVSSESKKLLDEQAQVVKDLRDQTAKADEEASKKIEAPNVDIKALSCVDKYSKFKVVVAYPWPSIDMLFDQLKNMACRMVDQKVTEMTSKVSLSKQMPYGLGNATVGVGAGNTGGASGGASGGATGGSTGRGYGGGGTIVDTKGVQVNQRNQSMNSRVIGGIENRMRY